MATRKIIKFGDKHDKLIKYYEKKYDEDEFNSFIIQLLTAYKEMKRKKIDLILLAELIKARPSDLDTVDIMSLMQNNDYVPIEKVTRKKETKVVVEPKAPTVEKKVTNTKPTNTSYQEEFDENIEEDKDKNLKDSSVSPVLLMGSLADEDD